MAFSRLIAIVADMMRRIAYLSTARWWGRAFPLIDLLGWFLFVGPF